MEKLVGLDPKNADALNYLGYSLAEEGRDLDKAVAMGRRGDGLQNDATAAFHDVVVELLDVELLLLVLHMRANLAADVVLPEPWSPTNIDRKSVV